MFGIYSNEKHHVQDCRPSPQQELEAIDRDEADISAVREALKVVASFEFGYELKQAHDGILTLFGAVDVIQLRLDKRRDEVIKSMPTENVKEPVPEQPEPENGFADEQEKKEAICIINEILAQAVARRAESQLLTHIFVGNTPVSKP